MRIRRIPSNARGYRATRAAEYLSARIDIQIGRSISAAPPQFAVRKLIARLHILLLPLLSSWTATKLISLSSLSTTLSRLTSLSVRLLPLLALALARLLTSLTALRTLLPLLLSLPGTAILPWPLPVRSAATLPQALQLVSQSIHVIERRRLCSGRPAVAPVLSTCRLLRLPHLVVELLQTTRNLPLSPV